MVSTRITLTTEESAQLLCVLDARMKYCVRVQNVFSDDPESIMHEIRMQDYRISEKLLAKVTKALRGPRSEEHTSELQSHSDLVCRLLLEKKKRLFVALHTAAHNPNLPEFGEHVRQAYTVLTMANRNYVAYTVKSPCSICCRHRLLLTHAS